MLGTRKPSNQQLPLEVRLQSWWQQAGAPWVHRLQHLVASVMMQALSSEGIAVLSGLVVWLWTPLQGMDTMGAVLVANIINGIFKWALLRPRPFWAYPEQVRNLGAEWEKDFSCPSGHAQMAAVFAYMYSSGQSWSAPATVVLYTLLLLVGLSRVYLGVHFFTDILLGWIIGTSMAILFEKLDPMVWLLTSPNISKIQVLLLAWGAAAVSFLSLYAVKHAVPPPNAGTINAWEKAGHQSLIAAGVQVDYVEHRIAKRRMGRLFTPAFGSLIGCGIGLVLSREYQWEFTMQHCQSPEDIPSTLLRTLLGMILLLPLYAIGFSSVIEKKLAPELEKPEVGEGDCTGELSQDDSEEIVTCFEDTAARGMDLNASVDSEYGGVIDVGEPFAHGVVLKSDFDDATVDVDEVIAVAHSASLGPKSGDCASVLSAKNAESLGATNEEKDLIVRNRWRSTSQHQFRLFLVRMIEVVIFATSSFWIFSSHALFDLIGLPGCPLDPTMLE